MDVLPELLETIEDGVATLTFNRPERMNALSTPIMQGLLDGLPRLAGDPAVKVVVLTGAGRAFCAGGDVKSMAEGGGEQRSAAEATARLRSRMEVSRILHELPKPTIAMINGPAAGLGFVIPLYADLRFAAESAVFTTAFAQRGLIAEHGVSWLLPRLVGLPAAMDLLCSARKFRAPEALSLGLVSRVIPDDKLMPETRAYATLLANTVSPRSVAVMKRQIWDAEFQTLAEATTQANHEMELSFQTADFKEGVAHFLEKRAARFTGK